MTLVRDSELPVTCTTCPYCGVGCGVEVRPVAGTFKVTGDKSHPANFGRLCSKGYALADTLGNENRLAEPKINNQEVSWSHALDRIALGFKSVIKKHGPEAVGFYVSGQLLTEDYYVVNKFVKGYLGTGNIDTNSRLCMASSVAGHKRAFGSDTVPGCYEDLELADLIVLVGSNLAWCHPVLLRRIESAREKNSNLNIVVIDPRATATAEIADLHLPIDAGGECDVLLFTGLLNYLVANEGVDQAWVQEHTNHFDEIRHASSDWGLDRVAAQTGLSQDIVQQFYQLFLQHEKVVTVYSQGVNQSCHGTDTVNSIINVHLATARIGKPGAGPFSITGQPNAMGGREVGGLANMLAAHMDCENESHRDIVQRFWGSPAIASKQGLKAVDMFDAVRRGQIKALWIMATNPADSMPAGNQVARAIARCPFVVVSDVSSESDTLEFATVQLPAQAWSEKDGTVTNSERRISRQRAFRTAPLQSRPDWWAVAEVAKRLGHTSDFSFLNASEIFAEHAALSGFENDGTRDFDISAYAEVNAEEYDSIEPFQWPAPVGVISNKSRMFGDGIFYTPDKKARFIKPDLARVAEKKSVVPVQALSAKQDGISVILNTGRIRDQWHTMTRTGYIPKLCSHIGEPFIELCEKDARHAGITDASLVDVASDLGSITVRALITDRVKSGTVFVPMHWSNVFASSARVNVLVEAKTDAVSGQPALKSQIAIVTPSKMLSHGFIIVRKHPRNLKFLTYWAITPVKNGWKVEFASQETPDVIREKLSQELGFTFSGLEVLTSQDDRQGYFNACWFRQDKLIQALYLAVNPVWAPRDQVESLFDRQYDTFSDRLSVLSGSGKNQQSKGAIVCSCMGVGKYTIENSIRNGAVDVQLVGVMCGAGTQCGSCRPEIKKLLKTTATNTTKVEPVPCAS